MNWFQKIGNKIEKEKENKKRVEDNFWKLSTDKQNRYSYEVKRLEKRFYSGDFPSFVYFYLKAVFNLGLFFILLTIFFGKNLFILGKFLISYLLIMSPIAMLIYLSIAIFSFMRKSEELKKLNKRFKLE